MDPSEARALDLSQETCISEEEIALSNRTEGLS